VIRAVIVLCVLVAVARAEPALSPERLYWRAGVLRLAPQTRSDELVLSGVEGPATLAVRNGPIAGSGATVDAVTLPAVIVGYTLPVLSDRLSLETVLALPFRARFRATGTLADMSIAPTVLGIPTGIPALGSELGEARAAPPILTAVYRIATLGPVRPYVGTGVAVLVAYGAHATNPVLTEAGQPRFIIDPAPGWALQAGCDVALWRRVFARVDVKYVAFMKAHSTVEDIRVRTPGIPLLGSAEVGTATMDIWLDPLVVQVAVGATL